MLAHDRAGEHEAVGPAGERPRPAPLRGHVFLERTGKRSRRFASTWGTRIPATTLRFYAHQALSDEELGVLEP